MQVPVRNFNMLLTLQCKGRVFKHWSLKPIEKLLIARLAGR